MALCEGQLLPQIKSENREDIKPNIPNKLGVTGAMPAVDYMSPRAHFVPPEIELYSHQSAHARQENPMTPNVTITVRTKNESPVTLSDDDLDHQQQLQSASSSAVKRKRGRPRLDKTSPEYAARRVRPVSVSPQSTSNDAGAKRKRGRPRVDKTSPEYLARHAAKMRARHEQSISARASSSTPGSTEKRKRGRPRVDKTSPEYIARKLQRERELMEKRAQRQYKRRNTADSNASSYGEETRMKRKYTKRGAGGEPKKRGRKKKVVLGPDGQPIESSSIGNMSVAPNMSDLMIGSPPPTSPQTLVNKAKARRNDLGMPRKRGRPSKSMQMQRGAIINSEPIPVDSDDDQLGSPSGRSDSLSLDENYRALRHLHEKYANIGSEDYTRLLQGNQQTEARSPSSSSSSSSGSDSSSDSESGSGSTTTTSDSSDSEPDKDERRKDNDQVVKNGDSKRADKAKSDGSSSDSSESVSVPEDYGEPGSGSLSESENESVDKRFQCHYCMKWYSTLVTLKIHRRIHLNRGKQGASSAPTSRRRDAERYECDVCLMTFPRREKLWDHKSSAHRGAMTVRCSVCRRAFEDEAELAVHTHTEDERQGRCSICGCVFPRYELLRRHKMSAHSFPSSSSSGGGGFGLSVGAGGGSGSHPCPQCNKIFSHAHSLARHLHNHANTVYRCVVCKQVYNDSDSLATHLNSHLANYKKLKP